MKMPSAVLAAAYALVFALSAAIAPAADSQAVPVKVPRPVYFARAQVDPSCDSEGAVLLAGAPEMLATSIASLQSFDRVDAVGRARSVVTVTTAPGATGTVIVTVQLLEAGQLRLKSSQSFAGSSLDLAAFRAFIDSTAVQFAPALDPVVPTADVVNVSAQQELIKAVKDTDYLDELDKRWEFTLWVSGVQRLLDSTGADANRPRAYFALDLMPLIAEADWFFARNLGMQLSLYVHSTNAFDFGSGSRYAAYGLFLYPGIGLVYRTLGLVSAEYAVTVSFGGIYLSATDGNVVDQNSNVVLAQGSTTWSRPSIKLRLSPALVWSITPAVALKAGIGLDIVLPGMFSWYKDSPLADYQFLTIGAAYRL